VVVTMVIYPYMPLLSIWFPGFIPPHVPPKIWE